MLKQSYISVNYALIQMVAATQPKTLVNRGFRFTRASYKPLHLPLNRATAFLITISRSYLVAFAAELLANPRACGIFRS